MVDQLMPLCDELEAGLARSQADSERLILSEYPAVMMRSGFSLIHFC
ncbi:MAG: hypothetical protein Q7U60_02060 [Candidatus Methanoperedens sp.]|nr:hypothetical protein [Candidatus Methanoperedens sp.]